MLKQSFKLISLTLFLMITIGATTTGASASRPHHLHLPLTNGQGRHARSFNVVASGTTPLTYKWYRNSNLVSARTTPKYTTPDHRRR